MKQMYCDKEKTCVGKLFGQENLDDHWKKSSLV